MGRFSKSVLALGAVAVLIVGGSAYALAASRGGTITVCVTHHGGALYRAKKCAKHDRKLTWNKQGRPGATGAQGSQGLQGAQGPQGAQGSQGAPAIASVTTRVNDSGANGTLVGAGALLTESVSCNAGEIATGGGGVSPIGGDADQPLGVVTLVASRPTPGTGAPTGWTVTFRNDDSSSHVLAWKIYAICVIPGS